MSTPTILCVDDERNVLLTLRTQLMRYFPDYAIEIAESGTEALIVVEELLNDGVEIPLVIADQIMPGMKGDQVLIELHQRHPQILKVMLTGEARAEDVGNVVNRGNLYRFMSKPWNEIDLQLTVTEALRCYHKEQQLTQKQLELEQANRELERLNASLEQQIQERTQQLRQNERQLRLFIEHTPVGVAMFDRHMNYVIASHRWINDYQLMERSNELDGSIIGKCHYDLFSNISDSWREAHQRGLQGVVTRNEKDHCILPDGREEWLRWEVLPWYDDDDNVAGVIIFGEIISDRIRTENALQESEERYRLLSEISPIGIFHYDAQGVSTYANAKTLEITGLSLEDNLGEGWTKNLHPDDRDQMSAAWNNFIELSNLGCDTEYEVEHRYIYPDGSIKWMFVQAVPERDIHGELIGFIGSVLDITNRKQVEEALRQIEAKQRALINALPDLIMRVSRDGVYLDFISTDTFKVLGDAQKLIGTKIEESLPPDLAARRMNAIHAALATKKMQIYEQELWVDGALQTEECRVVVCSDNDVLIVGRDISDRKQSERALKVSKKISDTKSRQVYSLINNIPHIAWLKDLDGRFLAVNQPFAQSCGYEPAQLVGLTDLDIWTPELAESYRRDDLDVMQSRQRKQLEERLVTAEGKVKWLETFKAPVIDESNESIGTAGIAIDITDRKQADLALQSLLHGTAYVTGKEFFPELVKQIAIALGVSHVYLDKQVGDCLETLAWYADQQLQSKFVYKIANTPCEVTLREGSYCCSNVKQLFSLNEHLVGADIDSYLGVALQNAEGKKLGVLCVLDRQPLSNQKHAEMLLHIFGARAIAELERMQALEDLQNLNAELERRVQERTKELSQTRNFLEAIIENLPVALFVKNGKANKFGEFLLWNKTSEIMFGCTKEQAIGKSVYDFFPKEQSDFFHAKDRNSFLFGQTEDIPEEPIDSLTLGRRILHTIKVPVFDEQGQPDYLICISEDITERKQVESALIVSEERFRAAFEQAAVGIGQVDLNGYFANVNQKLCDILGYTETELLSKSLREISGPDDFAKDEEQINKLLTGEIQAFFIEKCYIHKDGHIIWTNLNVSLVHKFDGSPEYLLGVVQDISDRKLAESKLQEERLRLQLALDAAQMGCWGCNLQTGQLFWSDRAQEVFGFVPGTFPGDRDTFLAMVYPDDYDRVVQAIDHTFSTGAPYQIEYRIRRLDGELRWIAVWGIIHQNPNRQLIGVVEDISDRKHAELEREHLLQNLSQLNIELEQANQQLGAYSQTLEQRVEERTTELQVAQERILAQEKLVSLGTLTAGIAHEIRNPLNFVKNYAEGSIELTQDLMEILQPVMQSHTSENNQLIEALIADLQENATTIRDHSQRADKIITSMMQHARTENEQTTMHPTLLHDLLNEALKLAYQSKELQHSSFQTVIETKYAPEIGLVEVIPNNLIRAFINLIDNACDAMWGKKQNFANNRDGSVYVPKLMIATQLVGNRVEIHIRDNGCGIDPKIQSRILDPFFTTKPPGSGTGLGLSLTHDIIVKQHQGDLKVNSNLGEFTETIVTIPLVMTGFN
ncbi:PAS domain S-box protein [Pseudanabaena yagii]|uniref:histidine kinase n=1 Tax=Pseudanabaena yagii GIHE-NHR1 TaxID=2722753 RepID=A0ABX1LU62_9CYAN|nr:PAS domain S-box protein [Pseudanabaena yagii]NMF58575.1 PAS domain S-box protein [Pseudanabaena yagii GIHE-NHR1]